VAYKRPIPLINLKLDVFMNLTFRAFLLATVATFALPAFAADSKPADKKEAAKPADAGKDYTILKVGNEEIKNSEVMDVWKGLFPNGSAPDFATFDENIRQNVLRGIVSERLIYQEAVKDGYDKSPEVEKRLEAMKKQVIMQSFMEDKAKTLVTDDQLKSAYNAKVAAMKGEEEIKASHILVASEDEAKKISDDLKKGGDFDKIAKEKSTDKASGANGGDLGWFTKDRMVPEFADAAFKLKKGEISAPVKTEFGWHIIKVEDRRPVKVPGFDEMKDALKGDVTNKAVQSYVEDMLKKSDVKYYDASGQEKDFPKIAVPKAMNDKAPAAGGKKDSEKKQ
jgi:peptidyl-prolyl cis-trans isomerase C